MPMTVLSSYEDPLKKFAVDTAPSGHKRESRAFRVSRAFSLLRRQSKSQI
jgi:hypothetical protein